MEGGCGGHPPWNNLETVESAVHYFNRGKSSIGIYGIMNESRLIHDRIIEPKDSIFCRYSHLAASGDLVWESQISSLIKAKKLGYSDQAILDLISGEDERLSPYKIDLKTDQYLLPTLSILRAEEKIQSELDVRLRFVSLQRLEALKSQVEFSKYLEKEKEEKKLLKQRSLKYLSEFFGKTDFSKEDYSPGSKANILFGYYKLKQQDFGIPAIFQYSGTTRIFIKEEIDPLFENLNKRVFYQKVFNKTLKYDFKDDKWIKPFIMGNSNFEIPILAADDARILNQITMVFGCSIVLVTNDNKLSMLAKGLAARNQNEFFNWRTYDYIKQSYYDKKNGFVPHSIEYYNPFKKNYIIAGSGICTYIMKQFSWRRGKRTLVILYDLPNIEKLLAKFTFDYQTMRQRNMSIPSRSVVRQSDHIVWDLSMPKMFSLIMKTT
jgi:hypothetical protein